MKKVLFVGLMVLLSMGMLFAVTDTDGTIPETAETDKVEFRLNLSGNGDDGDTSSWVIGFSSTPYDDGADDFTPITNGTPNDLEIDDTTHTASYGKDGNLHAYWNITSGTSAVVRLYMEGALTGTTTGEGTAPTLDWSISVGENGAGGTKDSVYGPDNAVVLVTTEPSKGVVSIGSKPVVVTTADISKATPDTYTGSLMISIATK